MAMITTSPGRVVARRVAMGFALLLAPLVVLLVVAIHSAPPNGPPAKVPIRAAASLTPAPLKAPTVTTHAQAVTEFDVADRAFAGATGACEILRIAPSRRDIYGVYEELSASRDYCEKAMDHAEDRLFGAAVPEPYRARLNKAIHDCGLAYTAKFEAYDSMMKVANGDSSPKAVLEAKKWMTTAAVQVPECMNAYEDAVAASGLDTAS